MKIISSQHFIDWEIVEAKMAELTEAEAEKVTIPCSYVGRIDGEEYAMQNDKHHTMAAARELGLEVVYDIQEDSEGLTGEDLLAARYNDGDWYDVETSDPAYGVFNLIW
jgi:hypothetical protein